MRSLAVSWNSAASVFDAYCSEVPAIAVQRGAPLVTMIAAGCVETKTVGASRAVILRLGICFFTSAKLASAGRAANDGGRLPAGSQGPFASGAASQPPLLSRNQRLVALSLKTSQLVLTAYESVVPATGVSTGSPSKTTRLAGRVLVKIRGGVLSSGTSPGLLNCERRLADTIAIGTRLTPISARAARIFSSRALARAGSKVGKFDLTSFGSVNTTARSGRSTVVANATSIVPRVAALAPAGCTPSTMRVSRVRKSAQEMTCG